MNIKIKELSFSYNSKNKILKNINLDFEEGILTVVLGPSGCGKTTLLRCIAGLETDFDGHIFIADKDQTNIKPFKRNISMLFQDFALYQALNVKENITLSLVSNNAPKHIIEEKLGIVTKMLGIEDLLMKKVTKLSGGERQRVAVARSLIRNPSVMLLDEPFTSLDAELKKKIRQDFKKNQRAMKLTSIMVTHDQEEAIELADKIVVMKDGQIQQSGTIEEIYNKPVNLFVANFIGSPKINIFEAAKINDLFGPSKSRYYGIRPEHFKIFDGDKVGNDVLLEAQLEDVVYSFPYNKYLFKTKHGEIRIIGNEDSTMKIGNKYKLIVDPTNVIKFN